MRHWIIALAVLSMANATHAQNREVNKPTCPPADKSLTHCVVVTMEKDNPGLRAQVAKQLKGEGYQADSDEGLLTVQLSAKALKKLFSARFVYKLVPASASDRTVCNAYIQGARIPKRYRKTIASISVGHQICE